MIPPANSWSKHNGETSRKFASVFLNWKDCNDISEKGCNYISKAQWKMLQHLNLSICFINVGLNKIQHQGCGNILKADWPELRKIYICTSLNTTENCGITEVGCRIIANKLNNHLKSLWCTSLIKIRSPQQNKINWVLVFERHCWGNQLWGKI